MSSEWQEYVKDTRPICKYGIKCYQKNPQHLATYKHPPQKKQKNRFHPYAKKEKLKSPDSPPISTTTKDDLITPPSSKDDIVNTQTKSEEKTVPIIDITKKNECPCYDNDDAPTFYSPDSINLIPELFLVEMPLDFYKFYECFKLDQDIRKTFGKVNLELIGPYDLLLGRLPIVNNKDLYLIHWRFFYDPPEFQSVLKKTGDREYHIGYFRDSPNEKPVFLAENDSSKSYNIKPIADNIFGAVYLYLQNEKKRSPFISMACQSLMQRIKEYAEQNSFSVAEFNIHQRLNKVMTKTLHGAGIMVPYNKKTKLGYRPLVENDATLKKLFKNLEAAENQSDKDKIICELQPVITYATIAVDECDFGTGLEAGIDLFCSGLKELEQSALSSLTAVYLLLNREPFGKIIEVHLRHRRKGPNLSLLNFNCEKSD